MSRSGNACSASSTISIDWGNLSQFNFLKVFNSELYCFEISMQLGLIPHKNSTFTCPKSCQGIVSYKTSKYRKPGYRFQCSNCNFTKSPLENTIFNEKHLSPQQIFQLIYLFLDEVPVTKAAIVLKIIKEAVVEYYLEFRQIMEIIISNDPRKLGGMGKIVECDECHISKRKYNRGRMLHSEHIWVFGAICRKTNDCFVVRVPNRTEDTLVAAMLAMIDQDSFIVTDSYILS